MNKNSLLQFTRPVLSVGKGSGPGGETQGPQGCFLISEKANKSAAKELTGRSVGR